MPVRWFALIVGMLGLSGLAPLPAVAAGKVEMANPHQRCLALIAYAEAAGEGPQGMAAVITVMRNRVADARFPKTACEVAVQPGQFQPVGERPGLRTALLDPGADPILALGGAAAVDREVLSVALRLAGAGPATTAADPTKGALYFVNPDLMDPEKCPWFADLKRTAEIGAHVFMTHYGAGERRNGPALDCRLAGRGRAALAKAAAPFPEGKPAAGRRVRVTFGEDTGDRRGERAGAARAMAAGTGLRQDRRVDRSLGQRVGGPRVSP